jgi:hypothetical protein
MICPPLGIPKESGPTQVGIIRALEPAKNKFIGIENRTIKEVHELRQETVEEVKLLEELVVEVGEERDQIERVKTPLATKDSSNS